MTEFNVLLYNISTGTMWRPENVKMLIMVHVREQNITSIPKKNVNMNVEDIYINKLKICRHKLKKEIN